MAKGSIKFGSAAGGGSGAKKLVASKVSGRRQTTDGAVTYGHKQGGGGGSPVFPKGKGGGIKTAKPAYTSAATAKGKGNPVGKGK